MRPIFEWNIWLGQMILSLIKKKSYKSSRLIPHASISTFRICCLTIPWVTAYWSPLCLKVWPLCFSLSVVMYSFCSLSIRFKFWTKSWSVFFSSSSFDSHSRSLDPLVVDEQTVLLLLILEMGTLSLGIVAFSKFASLGASCSYLTTFPFALDGSSIPVSPSDSSNSNFLSLIRLWTVRLSAMQFSVEWLKFSVW